jgi:hypothetical protein
MSFRRKREDVAKQRSWERFCQKNSDVICKIGLTEPVMRTEERFVDLLRWMRE